MNKMCLAADIPLIESGTAGFIGQVQPIKNVSYYSRVILLIALSCAYSH